MSYIVIERGLTPEQHQKAIGNLGDSEEINEHDEALKKANPKLWKHIRYDWLPWAREDILNQLKKSISHSTEYKASTGS